MDGVQVALQLLVVALVINILACLVRVVRGPTYRDRVTGVVLAGTTGAALLCTLSVLSGAPAVRSAALALVALALVVTVTIVTAEPGGR
ncbi:hypothetical protein HMPREF3086_14540 [Dietzia sp. HMSC21D01]|uniref:Multisubunit sodium/proton antiporter MrpF subunit n=2 Tax=Dietziaceae TaxID=85029 RepID=A0AAW5Q5S2_9ACTN|nr:MULTISPECIES: hypothetical protein [Dietzia]AVM64416.1 hypothetical protein C3V38_08470 [Dietzia sp. oral taxon 368]KZO58942.1 hypothetical protein A2U19_09275 [Dietzia maris]MBM7230089.1 hypothetical protein [Dietzia cinnamea]MCT1712243.1 hypothetical protein [Dietzia cinnamea]MCT1863567.1 hypothetical protein [Dietzia cinnamea]